MNNLAIWFFEKILSNREIHRWIIVHLRSIAASTANTVDDEIIEMLAERLDI